MKCSRACQECNRRFAIEYDESDGTLAFCPFCGEESNEGDTFDDGVYTGEGGSTDEWEEDFESFNR